jgi:pimeloyl-ACP methyl ester carboxylesterase
MQQGFRLPVTPEQDLAVLYQKPLEISAPPKPLLVMMHGFPGGDKEGPGGLFAEMETRFAQWGYPSVRFDFRGCGESDGVPADFTLDSAIEDLTAVLQWAQDTGHKSVILCGEEVGATVAIMGYAPGAVKALMLMWPSIVMKDTAFRPLFTREARMDIDRRDAPFVTYGKYRLGIHFYNDIYKTDLTPYLERITAPVMISHGSADEDVPLAQAYIARDHLKGHVEISVFEGGGHALPQANMRGAMYMNMQYFLAQVLKKA